MNTPSVRFAFMPAELFSFASRWRWSLALLAVLLVAGRVEAGPARGLIVIQDGTTAREYSAALEYSNLAVTGATFKADLVAGGSYSGLAGHIVAHVNYEDLTAEQLKRMESTAAAFKKAAVLLKPRIESLRNELAHPSAKPPPLSVTQGPPSIPEMKRGNDTFRNVVPLYVRDGLFSFRHDSGAFRVPVGLFPRRELLTLQTYNKGLQGNAEFQTALTSFVPELQINGVTHSGVREMSRSESEIVLLTDEGIVRVPPGQLSADAASKLADGKSKLDKMLAEITARQKEAERKEEERLAKIDEARREAIREANALQRAKLEREAEMWGAAAQVLGGLFSQPTVYLVR